MNFEKYSKQRFESLGLDTPASRKLAGELQDDVTEEIHAAVLAAFLNVMDAKYKPRINYSGIKALK